MIYEEPQTVVANASYVQEYSLEEYHRKSKNNAMLALYSFPKVQQLSIISQVNISFFGGHRQHRSLLVVL